jgi:protein involved in polysaccharide export with SLBB domain
VPLEGAIDPDLYVVGPGDSFVITNPLSGSTNSIVVGADGRLVIAEAGAFQADGLSLRVVRDSALAMHRRKFRNVRADISLAQPRQFYVHVTGAVPRPGRHLAVPVARLSNALTEAFADSTRGTNWNPALLPGLRTITIVRKDGAELHPDLLRYFSTGDLGQNPFLVDGDVIIVPGYDPEYSSVSVEGAVPFPGTYDLRPDDTLLNVLLVAGLREAPSHVSEVRVTRSDADGVSRSTFYPLAEVLAGRIDPIPLGALDHVSVAPDHQSGGLARVSGEVLHAGRYPIDQGTTTVLDLIDLAGGLTENAWVAGAYVVRSTAPGPVRVPGAAGLEGALATLGGFHAGDSLEVLRWARQVGLDYAGLSYFDLEMRLQNRVSIDLEAILAGGERPALIRPGDALIIPRDPEAVLVLGQVRRPGYVPFEPDLLTADYLQRAEGVTSLSADVYLIRGSTGEIADPAEARVRSGDIVFVDRNLPFAASSEAFQSIVQERSLGIQERSLGIQEKTLENQERMDRRQTRLQIVQLALATISTVGTVVALLYAVRGN